MPNLKLLVIGRQASGKDTLRRELEKHGISFVRSHTDRPMRPGEDPRGHIFVSKDEADHLLDTHDPCAYVEIGEYRYFALETEFRDSDAYIIDPSSIPALLESHPDTLFLGVYIVAQSQDRLEHATTRLAGDNAPDDPHTVISERESAENDMFEAIEQEIESVDTEGDTSTLPKNLLGWIVLPNDYTQETLNVIANQALVDFDASRNRIDHLSALCNYAVLTGLMSFDKDGNYVAPDRKTTFEPTELIRSMFANPSTTLDVFDAVISTVPDKDVMKALSDKLAAKRKLEEAIANV